MRVHFDVLGWLYVLVGAMAIVTGASVGVLVVGMLAVAGNQPETSAVGPIVRLFLASGALMIVTALWGLEKYIFPESQFFFPPRSGWVSNYLFAPTPMRTSSIGKNSSAPNAQRRATTTRPRWPASRAACRSGSAR